MTTSVSGIMILAAGLGTRLRPLTDERAKPMVPIGDRPAIAHVVERARGVAPRIVVNVHHRPEDLEAWAAAEGVAVSREPVLLGTAGGVARAAPLLGDGDVLVWNADIACALDAAALVAAHGDAGALATLAVAPRPRGAGTVGIAADGRVARLRGESFGDERAGGEFLGIHVLSAALRASLPREGCLVGDVYLPALRGGVRLATHAVDAPFVDVGTRAAYLAANLAWLRARGLSSWAHASATVRAPLDAAVVGAGAEIHASCTRAVVWPGAVVREPVADAVVTPRGVVDAR